MGYFVWFILDFYLLNIDFGHYTNVITGTMISILTMAGGYRFGRHRIRHEISYGLYIYHMIVINVFVMCGWVENIWFMFVVIAVTWIFAMLSNGLIEKPMVNKFVKI